MAVCCWLWVLCHCSLPLQPHPPPRPPAGDLHAVRGGLQVEIRNASQLQVDCLAHSRQVHSGDARGHHVGGLETASCHHLAAAAAWFAGEGRVGADR